MMECFLSEHDDLAMRLREQFFHGKDDADDAHDAEDAEGTAKDEPSNVASASGYSW